MVRYRQGIFRLKNPQKYKGDASRVVFRSSWEYEVMKWLDTHPQIIQWASEEPWFCIPYRHPLKPNGEISRYFPDFWVRKLNKDGSEQIFVLEIKPEKEVKPPAVLTGKRAMSKKNLYAQSTYVVNRAKWDTADKYCTSKGWKFLVLTEKNINNL